MRSAATTAPAVDLTSPIVSRSATPSKAASRAGLALAGLVLAFLAFDILVKLLRLPMVVEGTVQLGYPVDSILGIGITLLVCTVLYVIPRTSVLGAVLLTGYLGGAVATHVRVGHPLFSHILFPGYVGAMIWGSLLLRDPRLRAVFPLRRSDRTE